MANLLTYSEQQVLKPIAFDLDEEDYDPFIQDKETKYLEELLGLALLQDLQDNPATPENTLLLDGGGTYKDCYGNTVKARGVKLMLAYFFYADWIVEGGEWATFTGMVRKQRLDSQDVQQGAKDNRKSASLKIAFKYWDGIKKFLNENKSDYPLWNCCASKTPIRAKVLRGVR